MESSLPTDSPLLLFDGECGLCQALVRFALRRDSRGTLRVAPLQGVAGQAMLRRAGLPMEDFDSLVFFPDAARSESLLRTDGVVAVLRLVPGWGWAGSVLRALPRGWRDASYRLVARMRHRVIGPPRPDGLSDPRIAGRVLD
jgi:predicted DCC family thiol-disulfide oxidoreductase YuxK